MTAQAHDQVSWRGSDYLLVGLLGDTLFEPLDHGLVTRPTTTANWRGWIGHYAVRDDRLFLARLSDVGLALDPGAAAPLLNGVEPTSEGEWGPHCYENLDWPIEFTGRMIIARGFIQSLYRHMGFHPAWKFEESWELTFENGGLTGADDLSEQMRKTRADIESGTLGDPDDVTQPGWIERTFRLSFWRSKVKDR